MTSAKRLTGRHVLLMLVGFFGVMLVANAAFVIVAVRSFPGESEEKSYLQGVRFNETLAARAEQERLGWRAEIAKFDHNHLEMRFFDASGAGLTGLAVAGDLRRPAFNGADQPLIFDEMTPGVYRAEMNALAKGGWDLSGIAEDGRGGRFVFEARVSVK